MANNLNRYFTAIGLLLIVFVTGCTAKHYRRAADKQVYTIIQQAEMDVFGQTNNFRIDTSYAERQPSEVTVAEILTDRNHAGSRMLSLEDALNLAVTNSRRYQTEKERLYLTALTLTGQRHEFRPNFFGRGTVSADRLSNGERTAGINGAAGVSQLFRTGGSIGASIANDLLSYYTGDSRRSAVSTISINLLQPLLRGFGRNNPAVENLTQAERNVIYAVRNFSYFQDEFALQIVGDYFSLLGQKDVVRNRYTNYLSRLDSTKRLEQRAVDREAASDVDQARQAELTAKNNYVNAVAQFENALNQFKLTLGLPVSEKIYLDDTLLSELARAGLVTFGLGSAQAYALALERQLPTLNAIDQFEDSQRQIRLAVDRLKPDLNIFADASLQSDGPTDYTQFDPDNIRAGVGVQLDLPFDRMRERNAYRATLIAFESDLRNLGLTFDTLKDNIDRGLRTLEQRRQTLEIQRNALTLANRRVESATLLLQAGRAEVRDLVEAQDAQISALNAVTTALVGYQQERLQLLLTVGVLDTAAERFWLREHITPDMLGSDVLQAAATASDEIIPPDELFNR